MEWEPGPHAGESTETLRQQFLENAGKPGKAVRNEGDANAAIAASAKKVEATYEFPFAAHATMEPMNCTVHVTPAGCEVWVGSQVLSRAQATAAKAAGLPLEKVTVHNHLIGGGFGRRLEHDYAVEAALVSKAINGPVQVLWTSERCRSSSGAQHLPDRTRRLRR
jgi:isoquinoline 1-oxidoreductase beta subunit